MASLQNFVVTRLLNISTQTTSTNGSAVDLRGKVNPGSRNIKVYLTASAALGTTPNFNFKVQQSNSTGSGYTDVTGLTFTAITATTGGQEEKHGVVTQRYIRYVSTFDANTTSATFCAVAVVENRIT
jgi:hypothetical protein